MNAYRQLLQIRDMIGESTASHWSDRELLGHLNSSQARLRMLVAKSPGGWLTVSASVTPVDSVITWPVDCAKPIYLEETVSGMPIPWGTEVQDRRFSRQSIGYLDQIEAYQELGKIVINKESYTTACTLWYQIRVPELHVGTASAGGAASITLSAHDGAGVSSGGFGAKKVTSYYVNSYLEVDSGTGEGAQDLITAYTSARVATVSGTYGATSIYGTVSRLPEECHPLMCLEAALLALTKPSAAIDPKYFEFLKNRFDFQDKEFTEWCSTPYIGRKGTRITEIE